MNRPPSNLKVLTVFGTRPEAIKMAPIIKTLAKYSEKIESRVCVTAQHRDLVDQVLHLFNITPDWDLNLMRASQTLTSITCDVLAGMGSVFQQWRPDLVLVHGDTTTSFAASLAAFYDKIPVAHVEAGLRTGQKYSPWPEELNRRMTAVVADYHFAPTALAASNLRQEGIPAARISVTGNTVIDALLDISSRINEITQPSPDYHYLHEAKQQGRRIILVTGHRRENFGEGLASICEALKNLSQTERIEIYYPVHPNPNVLKPVMEALGDLPHVRLAKPLDYLPFVQILNLCDLVITDSGGIQEEAPSLGKPVLVTRNTTERPEAVDAGTVKLVGTNAEVIVSEVRKLLNDPDYYQQMSERANPYGDGQASELIVQTLISETFQRIVQA